MSSGYAELPWSGKRYDPTIGVMPGSRSPLAFVADCSRCVGLCCVALSRSRAGGFGADAPAGTPCQHLQADHRCEIHASLREDGWPACTVFDCFGAGQQVTQVTFGGQADWRAAPEVASSLFASFATMRHLMEMLRLLSEAHELARGATREEVRPLLDQLTALVSSPPEVLASADIPGWRGRVGPLLGQISEQHRAPAPRSRRFKPGAQLLGATLAGQDLSRHSLRSALLIASDLRGATFDRTDLLGADLRDAELGGADLRGAIFLTQQQVDAARGDAGTRLPGSLRPPPHWQ